MLENRDYMRSPPSRGGFGWSASTTLMVVLVAVFALQSINHVYVHSPIEYWLALTRDGMLSGFIWQLFTFQFLHGGLLHLAGNLLGIYFFGRFVEQVMGTKRFLASYFLCGIAGGMLQGLLMIMFPEHFGLAVFGASAGVAGIFAIFALLEREAEVRLYFVLPVRAMTLLWVFAGISLFFTLVPSGATAHAAHLGGILAGLAWVKSGWHHDYITLPWERWFSGWRRWSPLQSRQRKRELVRAASMRSRPWRKTPLPAEEVELPPDEFISREVDPILDKISQHGIHSLTEQERRILDAARKRMAKR